MKRRNRGEKAIQIENIVSSVFSEFLKKYDLVIFNTTEGAFINNSKLDTEVYIEGEMIKDVQKLCEDGQLSCTYKQGFCVVFFPSATEFGTHNMTDLSPVYKDEICDEFNKCIEDLNSQLSEKINSKTKTIFTPTKIPKTSLQISFSIIGEELKPELLPDCC